MRRLLLLTLAAGALAALVVAARLLHTAVAVGAGYAAKVTCSLVHNSHQRAAQVMRTYVAHEVAPLGPLLHVSASPAGATATALGLVHARAVYRPGLGCTLVPDAAAEPLPPAGGFDALPLPLPPALAWPVGSAGPTAEPPAPVVRALDRAFREPDPPLPGHIRQTTAIVVVDDGQLIAERYAPGYGPDTPMLSWSMAKSVLATLVGIAVGERRLAVHEPAPVPEWSAVTDPRHAITLDALLRMSSGLRFDEHYGAINDVSRMLFTAADMGAFAAAFPLEVPPDTRWAYSSGTSNIVARAFRHALGGEAAAVPHFARERLFTPVGMTSALLELDASGTPVGSSFAFMTARDWARLGELHRRDGMWNGQRILPEGWVRYVTTPTPGALRGEYGAHWWLNAGAPGKGTDRPWPSLPADTYAARGHSGQYVLVVPSARLVIVRLGLSIPDDGNEGAVELAADLIAALR